MGNTTGKGRRDWSKLSDDDITFFLNNTGFDRDQILDWHRGFLKESSNGTMDLEAFQTFYSRFFPRGDSAKFCKRVFKVFDADANGLIDFQEMLLAISVQSLGQLDRKLELAFQIYDLDKNGAIDKTEMEFVINAIFDLLDFEQAKRIGFMSSSERVKAIFDKLDKNSDHLLSKQEFIAGCMEDKVIRELLVPYI